MKDAQVGSLHVLSGSARFCEVSRAAGVVRRRRRRKEEKEEEEEETRRVQRTNDATVM